MREVVVIGAGIVGISLAHALSGRPGVKVTVLERDGQEPRGSTAYAPGFVGLYNDVPILTELARESAAVYESTGVGFRRTGGLELATWEAVPELRRRIDAARSAGLPAELLSASDLPESVTAFIDVRQVAAAARFADDGSADVPMLTETLRSEAISRGAQIRYAQEVVALDANGAGVTVVAASGERFSADAVALAAGVWGPTLARLTGFELPLFPVAHPYVYGPPASSWTPGPFVRWPERHVYARVHNDRLGIGSYDHPPVSVEQRDLGAGAGLAWTSEFAATIDLAQALLRREARFTPEHRVNGVFAMTPDNLPFLGRHSALPNVWVAQALWVTHAAGAAARLADALLDDADLPNELAVDRFDSADTTHLHDRALRLYRDIYANDAGPE